MKKMLRTSVFLALPMMLLSAGDAIADSKNLTIAMVQWRGETEAGRGFMAGMNDLGYSVQYTTMNAEQDRTKMGHILREELQPKLKEFDYVYTFGTTVTKATKLILGNRTPQIFTIVIDPVGAEIVQSMESPGDNISGASNAISLSLQFETAQKAMHFKKVGFLFNPREKNSVLIRSQLRKLAASRQFEVVDLRSAPTLSALKDNLQKLKDRSVIVDVVYLPGDSFMLTNAELIGSELRTARIKSIASIKKFIDEGALIGLVPDYYELGKAAAMIVDRHQKGEKLENIAVQTTREPRIVINNTTSQMLKMEFPEEILAKALIVD